MTTTPTRNQSCRARRSAFRFRPARPHVRHRRTADGYRVHTLSPDDDTPTGQVADREVQANYDDLDAVRDFARHVDVVTFEFENVSAAPPRPPHSFAPVRPAGSVLHTTQQALA